MIGRRLDLKKGPFILQCRGNGFTLSRLAPYKDWNDLRTEANLLWRQFRQRFASVPVSRIAVRYINEIKLPLPIVDFDEYLTAAPKSPTGVPQAFSQFLTRVMIPDEEKKCVSVISHVMEAPPEETPNGSSVTLLLDIDVFREILPPIVDDDRLWDGIDELRLQKNRMFFAHLTDKALELFA